MSRDHTEGKWFKKPNVVLVHGAWADGSCWSGVIRLLQEDGYNVIAPQFPLTSLADNVARLREVLAVQDGPTIVVGHSVRRTDHYRSWHRRTQCRWLWCILRLLLLTKGESIGGFPEQGPPPPAIANLRIDAQGFAWLPQSDFVNYFAADVDRQQANVMYAVQQPLSVSALSDVMGTPAWKTLPSWYLVATNDQAIPPDAEHFFAQRMGATHVEIKLSRVAMVSHPKEVTETN